MLLRNRPRKSGNPAPQAVYIGKDGYGVGFAKFASGAAWLGYYMFCGGRNPNHRLLQENRLTGYPNNYPIIDYDFRLL